MEHTLLEQALEDARETTRDQLAAAWQLQMDAVQEQLNAGWRDNLERIFEERFEELRERVAAGMAGELERRVRAARRDAAGRLNHSFRRVRSAEAGSEWQVLLEEVSAYASRCAVFELRGDVALGRGARGFPGQIPEDLRIALHSSAAFANVVATGEPVVAMKEAREISPALVSLAGASEEKATLFPLGNTGRPVGALYVEEMEDVAPVELLCAAFGGAIGARPTAGLLRIAPPAAASAEEPRWESVPEAERALHLAARRFARVKVAEMRLYKAAEVRAGRAGGDLYGALKAPIDAARAAFQKEFLNAPSMADYLHVELVKTLANDDAKLLGKDYPGPLR